MISVTVRDDATDEPLCEVFMNSVPAVGDIIVGFDGNNPRNRVRVVVVQHDVWPKWTPKAGDVAAKHYVHVYVEECR